MHRMALRQATVYSALLCFALALPAAGQGRGKVKQKPPTDVSPVGGADSLNNLKFRNLGPSRSEEHTSELQSRFDLVCRLLLEKKKKKKNTKLTKNKNNQKQNHKLIIIS